MSTIRKKGVRVRLTKHTEENGCPEVGSVGTVLGEGGALVPVKWEGGYNLGWPDIDGKETDTDCWAVDEEFLEVIG